MEIQNVNENFKEVNSVYEANATDLRIWKLLKYDGGKYIFAKRAKPLE